MLERKETAATPRRTRGPGPTVGDDGIRQINPLTDPDWEGKIARQRGASFFHGTNWVRVLHDTYGFRPTYFVEETAGRVGGILPFMEVDSWLTGRRGISLPFTDECPPLGADDRSIRRLVQAVGAYAAERRWKYWEMRGGTTALGAPAAVAYHGHAVDLLRPPATIFAQCGGSVRQAVRKAEQAGVTVTFSQSPAALRAFYGLLCKTRRRHGLPPQPLRFFENIQRHVLQHGRGCIVLARVQDRPVAGAVFFHLGPAAIFKFGASDEAFQQLRANNLVMWRAIEWHARAGFASLDLGRTSLDNTGLRRFKRSWGATERRIEYARFDCQTGAFVATPDHSSGRHNRVFRLLPSAIARLIGAAAYRHIA